MGSEAGTATDAPGKESHPKGFLLLLLELLYHRGHHILFLTELKAFCSV
jgi:hypothetical protein